MILRTDPAAPGDWTVVAVRETVVAVSDRARAEDLAARLVEPDGFRAALDHLVSRGISAAPDFALVDASGGIVRVVLRGAAEVVAGAERVSAAGVTTWTERVLEFTGALRLLVPGSRWTLVIDDAGSAATVLPAPVREDAPPHATLVPFPGDIAEVAPDPEPYAFLFGDTISDTVSGIDAQVPSSRTHDRSPSAVPVERGPVLALELPGGAVEPLTAPLLVGRSPSDQGDGSDRPPRLVKIAADDKDISRTHARIEVAGGAVVVTDLDSKNGTSVTMPGSAPRRLRAGEASIVLPDTLIDLGGGVTMTVRETVAEGVA